MSDDKYLKCYLEFDDEWPLSLVSIDAQKKRPNVHLSSLVWHLLLRQNT